MADPLPICYLNGEFLPLREARISPLDRGFLFGDSVYEVLPVYGGRMFRFREHFDRLDRSLREIGMQPPKTHQQWLELLEELIRRNGDVQMYVYVQVTRGAEFGRNHAFPENAAPTIFAMAAPLPTLSPAQQAEGLRAVTVEDFRWGRCDIKTTALLANVLMKQAAAAAGAHEAIIVRDGEALEGASSSLFVVIDGAVYTTPNSRRILPGTTRDAAIEFAGDVEPVRFRRITVPELFAAQEVWISAATRDVAPITSIDGKPIGDGRPGPMWRRMNAAFEAARTRLSGTPAI